MTSEEEVIWEDNGTGSPPGSRRDSSLPSLDCWDYTIELECLKGPEDLHLAAELGKTLLERNKELENETKSKQSQIDKLREKVEILTRQTATLRDTNESRIKLSESLETSIYDMDKAINRLSQDNTNLKTRVKELINAKKEMETKYEDLQVELDEAKEKANRFKKQLNIASPKKSLQTLEEKEALKSSYVDMLAVQVDELKRCKSRDQRRIAEIEAELKKKGEIIDALEDELFILRQKECQIKGLQEEIAVLEEARMNEVCNTCFKKMYGNAPGDVHPTVEQEDIMFGDHIDHFDVEDKNPYRHVVEKYEAIMGQRRMSKTTSIQNCLSLQDELKQLSVDYSSFPKEDTEVKCGKVTPTNFSEAETSSSGFSDETSHKATQTDPQPKPNSFLCSIEDGEDCRVLIYDNDCPMDNRFRKTPAYRSLFREIFEVLKRAASAKNESEPLPNLNDFVETGLKAPHATPCREDPPCDFDDLISIPDSIAASDTSSIPDCTEFNSKDQEFEESTGSKGTKDILEFVAANAARKKSRKRSSSRRKVIDVVVCDSPTSSTTSSPRRARRQMRRSAESSGTPSRSNNHASTTQAQDLDFSSSGPYVSSAVQEVAKLKRLEKSYAEVLRCTPGRTGYRTHTGKK